MLNEKLYQSGMVKLARMLPDPRIDRLPEHQRETAIRQRVMDYATVISPLLTNEQWMRAVKHCLTTCKFFPAPAELLEPSKTEREARAVETAAIAWELLLAAGDYHPSGTRWSRRSIEAKLGPAVGVAFETCGGQNAIAWMEADEREWVRKRFVEAYIEHVRFKPLEALPEPERARALAQKPTLALPAPPDEGEMTADEARAFVKQLEERLRDGAEKAS